MDAPTLTSRTEQLQVTTSAPPPLNAYNEKIYTLNMSMKLKINSRNVNLVESPYLDALRFTLIITRSPKVTLSQCHTNHY